MAPDQTRSGSWRVPLAGLLFAAAAVTVILALRAPDEEMPSALSRHAPGETAAVSRAAPQSIPTAPARATSPRTSSPPGALPQEKILRFSNEAQFDAFLARARAEGINTLGANRNLLSVRMHARDADALGPVEGAVQEPNFLIAAPEIPEFRDGSLDSAAAFGRKALEWLGAENGTLTWGKGVTIAVLDTGIDPSAPVARLLSGMVNVLGSPGSGDAEYSGHGTAVATLLLGEPGLPGIAPGASLLSVRVLDDNGIGNAFALADGITQAVERGAKILNLSLGTYHDSAIVRDAIAFAQSRGAIIVAAAGNEGINAVSYPARYDSVIAVAATDADNHVPYFSNRGAVDVAAPGVGVTTRWDGANLVDFSGTSAAVPYVSGAIAGLLSQYPSMTASAAAEALLHTANDAGLPGPDPEYGAGVLSISRINERNTSGIKRLEIADHYVNAAGAGNTQVPVIVSAQNRGTTALQNVRLFVEVGGVTTQQTVPYLEPGKTISSSVNISLMPGQRQTTIRSWAKSSTAGTSAPERTSTITFGKPQN